MCRHPLPCRPDRGSAPFSLTPGRFTFLSLIPALLSNNNDVMVTHGMIIVQDSKPAVWLASPESLSSYQYHYRMEAMTSPFCEDREASACLLPPSFSCSLP